MTGNRGMAPGEDLLRRRFCSSLPLMTQPGVGGFGWNMLLGEVMGALVVIGAFIGRFKIRKLRAEARKERPPQREKVLRPAGYSASCRIDDLMERRLLSFVYTFASAMTVGIMCIGFLPLAQGLVAGRFTFAQMRGVANRHLLWTGVGMTVAAVAGVIWCFRRTATLDDELRNWRFGVRGEQAVAEKLMSPELTEMGYVAFHDLTGDGAWDSLFCPGAPACPLGFTMLERIGPGRAAPLHLLGSLSRVVDGPDFRQRKSSPALRRVCQAKNGGAETSPRNPPSPGQLRVLDRISDTPSPSQARDIAGFRTSAVVFCSREPRIL